MRLSNKVAIVTGAGGGIGLAIVARLGSEGARVAAAGLHAANTEEAAEVARKVGAPDAFGIVCDVSDDAAVAHCCDVTERRLGRIDIVVNNAGVMTFEPLQKLTRVDWMKVLAVDLLGAAAFTREAFLRMKSGGAIVNISSVHAVETTPYVAPYAASKAALLSLTRSASIEGRPLGIRANALLPGAIDTPMLWENPNLKSGAEKIPPGDIGKPEDVAAAVAFLVSDDARFISGAALRIDGGRLAELS